MSAIVDIEIHRGYDKDFRLRWLNACEFDINFNEYVVDLSVKSIKDNKEVLKITSDNGISIVSDANPRKEESVLRVLFNRNIVDKFLPEDVYLYNLDALQVSTDFKQVLVTGKIQINNDYGNTS